MVRVENYYMIEQFTPHRSDPAFSDTVLPWGAIRTANRLNAHPPECVGHLTAVLAIAVGRLAVGQIAIAAPIGNHGGATPGLCLDRRLTSRKPIWTTTDASGSRKHGREVEVAVWNSGAERRPTADEAQGSRSTEPPSTRTGFG